MVPEWKRLSAKEKADLLKSEGVTRTGPHNMKGKVLHWPYCGNCGLLALKNDVSRAALRSLCRHKE